MYPYITIFNNQITSYGLMLMLGYCIGFIIVLKRASIYKVDKTDIFVSYILAGFGALMGGKLFYVIQGIPQFIKLNAEMGLSFYDYFMNSGLVFYGGFIGCIIFIGISCAIFKIKFWNLIDVLLPALPLAQAVGRIGCFLVGCCYGIPFDDGFDMSASPFINTHTHLLPIQLIESAAAAVLFIYMIIYGKKQHVPGKLLGIYMIGYGFIRFVTEFFRGDTIRGFYGIFSTSQWISIIVFVIGMYLFIGYSIRHKNNYALN